LERDTTHRYNANSFKLHRLPMPRPGEVLGLVGTNGIGKSTALKVLAGKTKPNLGRFTVSENLASIHWLNLLKVFSQSNWMGYVGRLRGYLAFSELSQWIGGYNNATWTNTNLSRQTWVVKTSISFYTPDCMG